MVYWLANRLQIGAGVYPLAFNESLAVTALLVFSDIPVTETQTDTEKIDISKTDTETSTEKIFNTDTVYI